MTTVIMSDEDAELFKTFLQFRGFIGAVLDQLPMANGSMSIHFDDKGTFKGIKKEFWSLKI